MSLTTLIMVGHIFNPLGITFEDKAAYMGK